MARKISDSVLKEFSPKLNTFIDEVEETLISSDRVTPITDLATDEDYHSSLVYEVSHITSADEDKATLIVATEDEFDSVPLNQQIIIRIERNDKGFFNPIFRFLGAEAEQRGVQLWLNILDKIERDEEESLERERHREIYGGVTYNSVFVEEEKEIHLTPKGNIYTKEDIEGFFAQTKLLGDKSFDIEYSLDDYLEGKMAEDILHPAPKIITTKRELMTVLHDFKCSYGLKNWLEVSKVLTLSASQVYAYAKGEFYPTHKSTKSILERRLNIVIGKEVK